MVKDEMINYIKEQKKAGYTDEQLREVLIGQKYDSKTIDEAFSEVNTPPPMEKSDTKLEPLKNTSESNSSNPESLNTSSTKSPIKKRNPWMVILLSIITGGIYTLIWFIMTAKELHENTSSGPKPSMLWFLLIPGVNFFVLLIFLWKYFKAIGELTGANNIMLFILYLVISPVSIYMTQTELNKKATI